MDQNIKHLERRLGVNIRSRGNEFQLSGAPDAVRAAEALLHQLYRETVDRDVIEPDFVHVLADGRIIKSGDKALALKLEAKGYSWLDDGEVA